MMPAFRNKQAVSTHGGSFLSTTLQPMINSCTYMQHIGYSATALPGMYPLQREGHMSDAVQKLKVV